MGGEEEMGDKSEVLDAVLKEAVDLVIDLKSPEAFCWFAWFPFSIDCVFGSVLGPCECRKTYPLRKFLTI